jgi:hypothetical protein
MPLRLGQICLTHANTSYSVDSDRQASPASRSGQRSLFVAQRYTSMLAQRAVGHCALRPTTGFTHRLPHRRGRACSSTGNGRRQLAPTAGAEVDAATALKLVDRLGAKAARTGTKDTNSDAE